VNTRENVPPGGTLPESHSESGVSLVEVWEVVLVAFVHRTVSPMLTLIELGVKTKFVIETFAVAPRATDWPRRTSSTPAGTALRARRIMANSFPLEENDPG